MEPKTMLLTGPEFLDAVADQETACGNPVNADTYRQRATEWASDRRQLEEALQRESVLLLQLKTARTALAA